MNGIDFYGRVHQKTESLWSTLKILEFPQTASEKRLNLAKMPLRRFFERVKKTVPRAGALKQAPLEPDQGRHILFSTLYDQLKSELAVCRPLCPEPEPDVNQNKINILFRGSDLYFYMGQIGVMVFAWTEMRKLKIITN